MRSTQKSQKFEKVIWYKVEKHVKGKYMFNVYYGQSRKRALDILKKKATLKEHSVKYYMTEKYKDIL
jgi:hypothetical protein